jgi:hypothetical protein
MYVQGARSNQRMMFKPMPLTVASVFEKMNTIARLSGAAVSSF